MVIETPHANWFLLDTLQKVNNVTGEVGQDQRAWLAAEIDRRGDTPAIIVGHHNPQRGPVVEGKRITGLADTADLMALWHSKPQVKLYMHGHTHNYALSKTAEDIHLLNQPPVAYLFDDERPNGWLRAELTPNGMVTELRALDKAHSEHQQHSTLAWR